MELTEKILELIRLTSTDLPPDVEEAIRKAREEEDAGSAARDVLGTMLENMELARKYSTPICQDTGTPIFTIKHPPSWSTGALIQQAREAVQEATARTYLRPNAVHALTGKNSGNNLGDEYYPVFHFEEIPGERMTIDLMLKGGGCENVGAQYALPHNGLKAGRDLEGVRRAVLDAVYQAQGKGCAPGVLGVAIGGDRGTSYLASKEALLRGLDERNPDPVLAELEKRLTKEANQLGIGPMGFSGKTTILGTRIKALYRLPASYFVSISYMCWAYRRRRLTVSGGQIEFS